MSKTTSLVCALITTFIWGTAFIAQDTGMDNIGPLSFNAARFFVGFFTILPIAIILERKKILVEVNSNKKLFFKFLIMMSVSLFLGTYLQQTSLLYTNIANSAFFTVFYVPIVPIMATAMKPQNTRRTSAIRRDLAGSGRAGQTRFRNFASN